MFSNAEGNTKLNQHYLGSRGESAGIVSSVGPEVTTLEIGDRVMMLGGGLVDRVNVHEMGVWKVPESFALEKAAAVPVNYGTTWFCFT